MNKKGNRAVLTLLLGVVGSCTVTSGASFNYTNNIYSMDSSVNFSKERSTSQQAVLTESVYLRETASWSAKKGIIVSKGKEVQIVSKGSSWSKVKYGNDTGYVVNDYLNIKNNSNTTTSSTNVLYTGVVNTYALNVRKGSSVDYASIGGLTRGTKVEIVNKLSNGWFKIKYQNEYGYINGKYVTNVVANTSGSNTTSNATTVTYTAIVNTNSLNVRNGGSVSYSIIGKVTKGTKVEIVDKMSNGWSKIKYSSGYGYVNTSYLTNISTTSSNNTLTIKIGSVNTTTLNVRSGASTSCTKIGSLSKGTKVEIVKTESNGWYKIKYGSGYGYVSGAYVTIPGETNTLNNLNNFLFVGDSFTVLLSNTIKAKNDNVYIHAKSGSMPSYWINKVSNMPSNSSVEGVVLLIGVNGAGYESNKTDVKTLINKLSAKYPNKTIYVQKIFPVGRNFANANPYNFNQKIKSLNSVIESHCKTVSNAKFIDTTSGFIDSSGYLINTYDGLHISSPYNNQFYNNILNAVKKAGN